MKWCERCLSDHEGPCLDEDMRRDTSEAMRAYFENERIAAPVRHPYELGDRAKGRDPEA